MLDKPTCSVPECTRAHDCHGFCKLHGGRIRRHGDISAHRIRGTLEERFWPKVNKVGPLPDYAPHLGPCWLWMAGKIRGYGNFRTQGGTQAHRFAYSLEFGTIPDGLELDHLCRNRACVRPSHLEAVTGLVNIRRGYAARYTGFCRHGHPYTPENSGYRPSGKRYCRLCQRERGIHRRRKALELRNA